MTALEYICLTLLSFNRASGPMCGHTIKMVLFASYAFLWVLNSVSFNAEVEGKGKWTLRTKGKLINRTLLRKSKRYRPVSTVTHVGDSVARLVIFSEFYLARLVLELFCLRKYVHQLQIERKAFPNLR